MRQEPPLFMHQNRAYWGQIAFASIAFDLNSTCSVHVWEFLFAFSPTIEVTIFIKIEARK